MFVSDIIEDLKEILAKDDLKFIFRRLSKAIQALQDEGDWKANIGTLDVCSCTDGHLVTLPRDVETPMAVAVNNRPAFMRNEFFRYHINGDGIERNGVSWAWDDNGTVPTFMDIRKPGALIAIAELESDLAERVRVLGFDEASRVLRQQLEDGTFIDGIEIPMNLITDFPGGILQEPNDRLFQRIFTIQPMINLISLTDHEIATGDYMQITLKSGSMPVPISDGGFYYVRVVDPLRVTLHKSRLDATTGQSPVEVSEIVANSVVTLTDKRSVSARTKFQTTGDTLLADLDPVTFVGTPVPAPLNSTSLYIAKILSNNSFAIYGSTDDANEDINPINVYTPGTNVRVRSLKPSNPITTLNFTVRHNLFTNDVVTVENTGGELPEPLLAGASYFVRVINNYSITLHPTLADATNNLNAIALTTAGSGTSSVVKVIPASALLGNTSNINAPGHNLSQPAGSGALATAALTSTSVGSVTVTNGGSGYEASPKVIFSGGGGTGASAQAIVTGGVVTAINVITAGTGYTSPPTVTLQPAAGSFVRFSTNGTFPAPIAQGTVYRAEPPMSADSFTLNTTLPEPVNITSLGSGNLFLVISRSFSIGFLPQWRVDATNYVTGQEIRFFTQGVLPTTSPQVDQDTVYFVRKISNATIEIYDTLPNAQNLAATTGRISVITLGSGQLYFSSERAVTAVVRDNFLDIEFSGYISNLADVKFETDGTLPAPLSPATTYQASIVDGKLQVLDTNGAIIVLTNIGTGLHSMILARDFSVDPSTSLVIPNQQFNLGDEFRVQSTEELPAPLSDAVAYFIRPIGANNVEVYNTQANAINTGSEAGRLTFLSTGEGIHRTLQILPAFQVSRVTQIEKKLTNGYITMYAWDDGRNDNVTLLGEFHPTELNPAYRRIRVGVKCAGVSMRYRKRSVEIFGLRDFINLDSSMAILCMVKSHQLLLDNFVDEAERFRIEAVNNLNKRNRAIAGPEAPTLQINADVMTDPDDFMT